MLRSHSLPLLALAGALTAQNTIVSPLSCTAAEGDSQNTFPFVANTARRYLQIHADLGPTPRVITKIGFRVAASTLNYPGTRTHDLELYMGDAVPSAQQLPNLTFDANYASPKQTVLPRQLVTFGPTGTSSTPGPNPFDPLLEITLATPFVYTGTAPLIWEVAYFGSTTAGGNTSTLDADGSTTTTATSTVTGIGCAATGATALMTHAYTVLDVAGTLTMNGTIANGPPNAFALMAIGFSNPNAPAPGVVCSNVYTNAVLVQFLGITSATGSFNADNPTGAIVVPNNATGIPIHTQAFAVDPTNPGLFLIASNGRVSTVPAVGTAEVNLVSRLYNSAGGTTATTAAFATSIVGYGLATQFTYL